MFKLSKEQQEIVNSKANKIIVEAGAGAGKTATLIARIKHILEQGVKPSNIVAITLTNMAAEEMKERLIDIQGIGDCFIGTIHSFANKILKTSNDNYKLFTKEIQDQFMNVLISLYAKYTTMSDWFQYSEYMKKVETGLMTYDELKYKFPDSVFYEIQCLLGKAKGFGEFSYKENLKTLCKKHNVITFDELLEKTTQYFKEINGKVEYLFVDEFQDIGLLEYNFFKALNADNYFFVGDEKQNIYRF